MTCAADAIESFANTAMVLTNTGHVTSGFRDGVHANVIERVQIANSGRMDGFEFAINTLGTGACDVAEKLDLTAFGYASLAVLAADATNSGLGLVFDFSHGGGGSLTDAGLTLAMLSAVDVTL